METYRIRISYDGTQYAGWQRQAGQRTVESEVFAALERLAHGDVHLEPAGRTDSGVHARGQVATVKMKSRAELPKLLLALNRHLPDDVAVREVALAPEQFSARSHAIGKRYLYRILTAIPRDPFIHGRAWHYKGPIDVAAMRRAAQDLVGEIDFESFRAKACQAAHARRSIWYISVERPDDESLFIDVRGNAFCQNMVRIIVGTLVEVGRGRRTADSMPAVLEARERSAAGQTAPAHGLSLDKVYYPDDLTGAKIPDGATFPRYPVSDDSWPFKDSDFQVYVHRYDRDGKA